jgi:hypothetical protein
VPAMAIIFGARTSAAALWIGSTNALRLGTVRGTFNFRCSVGRDLQSGHG